MAHLPQESAIMAVLGRTFLAWRRHLQRHVAKSGVSIQQYFVLRQLGRRGQLRPSDIASALFCDRPTASVVIQNLTGSGLASVTPDATDGRQRQVTITAAGRAVLRVAEHSAAAAREALDPLSCLSGDEKLQLWGLLTRLELHIATAAEPAGAATDDRVSS